MVLVSIKSDAEIVQPSRFPRSRTFQRYVEVIRQKHKLVTHFRRQLLNSTLLSLGTAILTLSVSTTCAYAISHLVFPGRKTIFRASLFTYMVPSSFIVIPFYGLMVKYGLVNSYLSAILAETTFATPYCIWSRAWPWERSSNPAGMHEGGRPVKPFATLFGPGQIGTVRLPNRIVMPPMATNYADPDGFVTERQIAYDLGNRGRARRDEGRGGGCSTRASGHAV